MDDSIWALGLDSMEAKPEPVESAFPMPEPEDSAREPSDEQLMAAYARGSAEAFGQLFARYRQPLFGFFFRRSSDPGLAEELTQESFIAVIRAAGRYRPSATFRTYLYAIAFRMLRAHRRKAAFRAIFRGDMPEGREPAASAGIEADFTLREALGKLDAMEREVLMLREFEQLSYAEIAELLDLPLNTVRSRLFRARTALRELLAAPARQAAAEPGRQI